MKKMLNEEELKLKRAIQNIDIVPRELCFSKGRVKKKDIREGFKKKK